ncbi:MAG TPA: tetratricopeptide repeat protein, partial [Candidatus Methylacidiphilales bacterium]|nr:tetratricopeptide repeat protein [Candidatus Methylacidiphilales bacterium]
VLCLCAWWVHGRCQGRDLARVGPVFIMSAGACILSVWTQGEQLQTAGDSAPERIVTAGIAVWFYLGKLIWPHPLMAIYPGWSVGAGQVIAYLPVLAVMIILAVLWIRRERWSRGAFFALAYFLVALLPVLGLVDMSFLHYAPVADHFQYLASMAPLALAGAGLAQLIHFILPKKIWIQSGLYAGLLLILGIWSWQRIWVYQTEETLWADAVAKNPNCWLGRNNLGGVFYAQGQVDRAMAQFQKAVDINPNYAEARNNLANCLLSQGQVDEALVQFQKASELHPDDATVHRGLGRALAQKGEVPQAIEQFQKVLAIDPNDTEAHKNLGDLLFREGRMAEAAEQYEEALSNDPHYANYRKNVEEQESPGQSAPAKN